MTTINGNAGPTPLTVTDYPSTSPTSSTSVDQASLLQPPENALLFSGDPGAMVAALTVMAGKEQSAGARADRRNAEIAQESAEQSKLSHMKDAADARLEAGIWSGAGQIGAGLAEGAEAGCTSSGNSAVTNQRVHAATSAEADGAKGGTQIVSSCFKHEADIADMQSAADDMKIGQAKRHYDDAADNVKDSRKLLSDAIDFYREYSSSKAQTELAAIHRA